MRQPALHKGYDPKTRTNQVEKLQIRKHTHIQEQQSAQGYNYLLKQKDSPADKWTKGKKNPLSSKKFSVLSI